MKEKLNLKKKSSEILFTGSDGKDVTFEDLLRKIYENAEAKNFHLLQTSELLKPFVQENIQNAVLMLPHIASLQSISVKNDEQLVKMAAIVARGKNKSNDESDMDSFGLTPELRDELMAQAKELSKPKPGQAKSDI